MYQLKGEFIRNYDTYQPNKAHLALAELEKIGIVRHVITQNIDGLHKKAGIGLSGILEKVKKILG